MNPPRLPVPIGFLRLFQKTIKASYPLLSRLAQVRRSRLPDELEIVAVVGSFGKSTTTRLVRAILGLDTSMKATKNTGSFVALAILALNRKTPVGVLEVGIDGPGQMESHANMVSPTIAIVTCIGSEHRLSLKNLETTRHEKAFMVRCLPLDGTAILNGDDPNVMWMASQTQARVKTFGFGPGNDTRILSYEVDWPVGMRAVLELRGEKLEFVTRLLGRPGLYALAAAATVADLLNVPMEIVKREVGDFEPTPGRLDIVHFKDRVYFLRDDFKSARETIFEALHVLGSIDVADKLVVLGEETESDISRHRLYREIGTLIGKMGGHVIFQGTSKRYRNLKHGFVQAGGPVKNMRHSESIQETIKLTMDNLVSDQVILLKGRGVQKLGRVAMALAEGELRCQLNFCRLKIDCSACPRWFAGKNAVKL